jgi:hypothetical protein
MRKRSALRSNVSAKSAKDKPDLTRLKKMAQISVRSCNPRGHPSLMIW